ncbi:cyclic nucleotide-binding domain-containing protein, partial [Thermodesulfobacteriota bacterium]
MSTGEELFGTVYKRGDIIYHQGTPGDTMYVVQSGAVELSRVHGGKETVLRLVEAGDFFGESALIEAKNRSTTAQALRRSRILPLSRDSLVDHAERDPSILTHLIAGLSKRINEAIRRLRSLVDGDESLRRALAADTDRPETDIQPGTEEAGEVDTGLKPMVSTSPGERLPGPDTKPVDRPFTINEESTISFASGDRIFDQGDQADTMYLVLEGQVRITHEHCGEAEHAVTLGPREVFGEMALIPGSRRLETAISITNTTLFPMSRETVISRAVSDARFGLFIVQVLITRLRMANAALEDPEGGNFG